MKVNCNMMSDADLMGDMWNIPHAEKTLHKIVQ